MNKKVEEWIESSGATSYVLHCGLCFLDEVIEFDIDIIIDNLILTIIISEIDSLLQELTYENYSIKYEKTLSYE